MENKTMNQGNDVVWEKSQTYSEQYTNNGQTKGVAVQHNASSDQAPEVRVLEHDNGQVKTFTKTPGANFNPQQEVRDRLQGMGDKQITQQQSGNMGALENNPREGLMAMFNSTNGKNWKSSVGWGSSNHECTWKGVKCFNLSIAAIKLWENNIQGFLPAELFLGIPTLVHLGLGANKISGVSLEMYRHPHLNEIWLQENGLTGRLPEDMCSMKQLQTLSLSFNQISGTIPACYGALPSLAHLYLDSNPLQGPIPPELGNLSSLRLLTLDRTHLTGPIPSALGLLSQLLILKLGWADLTGTIPREIFELPALQVLDLSNNSLTGALPVAMMGGESLTDLNVRSNRLKGDLTPLIHFESLAAVDASDNHFSGDPSVVIHGLSSLVMFAASDNKFEVQEELAITHAMLMMLDLSRCQISTIVSKLSFPASRKGMAKLDSNPFYCPYPLSPPAFNFNHDSCTVAPMTWLRVVVALLGFSMLCFPFLLAISLKESLRHRMRVIRLSMRIPKVLVNLFILSEMIRYLSQAEYPSCDVLNDRTVFIRFMPWRLLYSDSESDFEQPQNVTAWPGYQDFLLTMTPRIRNDNTNAFKQLCEAFTSCKYVGQAGCQSQTIQVFPHDPLRLRIVATVLIGWICAQETIKGMLVVLVHSKGPDRCPLLTVLCLSSIGLCVAMLSENCPFHGYLKNVKLSRLQLTVQFVDTIILESIPLTLLSVAYALKAARTGLPWEFYLGIGMNFLSVAYFVEKFWPKENLSTRPLDRGSPGLQHDYHQLHN